MAEEKGVSPFPNPPSLFYKLYTDENVKAGLASKPPRPTKGEYHMFGQPFNVSIKYTSFKCYSAVYFSCYPF